MTKRRHPEDDLQARIVKTLRTMPGLFVFAVPNGGYRTMGDAMALRRTGTVAGVPDLMCIRDDGRCMGVELKAPGIIKNKDAAHIYCSEDQRLVHRKLRALDVPVFVTDSHDEAVEEVERWAQ